MSSTLVAAVQMHANRDKAANLRTAERLVEKAAQRGATLIVLPELFNCTDEWPHIVAQAEPIPGCTSVRMSALAARLNITLLAGSFETRNAPSRRQEN